MTPSTTDGEIDKILFQFLQDHSKAQAHDRLQEHNNADTKAKAAIQEHLQRAVLEARIDELERILEAGGGHDFVNQMANAVGQVGRRYKELKGEADD